MTPTPLTERLAELARRIVNECNEKCVLVDLEGKHLGFDPDEAYLLVEQMLVSGLDSLLSGAKQKYPHPCGLCPGQIESEADLDWHGLGNCVPICERCTGSGIEPTKLTRAEEAEAAALEAKGARWIQSGPQALAAAHRAGMEEAARHVPHAMRQGESFWIACSCRWNEAGGLRGMSCTDLSKSKWTEHICEAAAIRKAMEEGKV
jgi:hypothetical protein